MSTSKLTDQQKQEVRMLLASGARRKDIAKQYGVSPQAIGRATVGVERVAEHRGRHKKKKLPGRITHKEDLNW